MITHEKQVLMKKIMNEFAKTVELFGLTPLEARLFAYLYLTEDIMTLDEMSEALGKSKTSMSTSIRGLAELNLVSRVWRKGVRKDLYRANTQLFKLFITSYMNKWVDATNHRKEGLYEIKKWLQTQDKDAIHSDDTAPDLDEKLDQIITFHKQVATFFNNLQK
ncbi:GbsR/MarR family transcriptional regulator [Virgibacillus soli]|uniref:HTH-type transcriptional regulator n=1 Tax=Paracerasibacillus soli TaxID=480284 RepID=A0ABU5CPK3_9BACI|nr:transcriptional regulator [Virgibacillus soli]MDY0407816.1 transcriptional regulator [Virgibacillus soli]